MTAYRCPCGCTFDRSEAVEVETCGADYRDVETTLHCPECDGEDFDDVILCDVCREADAEPGADQCRDCLNVIAAEEAERRHDAAREQFA